jgi:hypothetical protein
MLWIATAAPIPESCNAENGTKHSSPRPISPPIVISLKVFLTIKWTDDFNVSANSRNSAKVFYCFQQDTQLNMQ